MGSSSRRWLNQSTHSRVAFSTASKDRQGPRRCLVEPTDRFGQSVVVAIVYAANRRFDSSLREALSVFDGHLLGPTVAMMNEAAPMGRPSIVKRLFRGIEDEAGMSRPAGPPTHDPPSIGIDDEGDIDEPRPGRDAGEV